MLNLAKVNVGHYAETIEAVEALIKNPATGSQSDSSFIASSFDGVASSDIKGGIDFNAENMNVTTKGDEIDFNIPLDMQNIDFTNIEGFVPIIINIAPATNIYQLLGLDEPEGELDFEKEQVSSVNSLLADEPRYAKL